MCIRDSFLILVIKAVGQSRFSSTNINGLCGVEIIKLTFVKVIALTIRDKFLFFAFLLYLTHQGAQQEDESIYLKKA